MADNFPNSISSPGSASAAAPSAPRGPDFSEEVRHEVMGGLESAIEVTSTQAAGGGQQDDGKPAAQKTSSAATDDAAVPSLPADVSHIPQETLRTTLHAKIMDQLKVLDATAEKLKLSSSKSRAFNFTQVVSEMRRLNVSLLSLYRMSIEALRSLYVRLK